MINLCLVPPLESSESDSDAEEGEVAVPPVPPRTASMSGEQKPQAVQSAESARNALRPRLETVTLKKKVPPPKPPRPTKGWGEEGEGEGTQRRICEEKTEGEVDQRVNGGTADTSTESHPQSTMVPVHSESQAIPPKLGLPRQRSKSSECVSERHHCTHVGSPRTTEDTESSSSTPTGKPKVSLLIEMFESKSPNSSPKRNHVPKKWGATAERAEDNGEGTGSPRQRHWSCTQSDVPTPPPKPHVVIPPVPPRPLSTECGEEGVPIVPPRTPAPLLPPKPPGSLPPAISPRSWHRRSHSDTRSDMAQFAMEEVPPEVPPK